MVLGIATLLGGIGAGLAGGIGYGFGLRYGFERVFPAFQSRGKISDATDIVWSDIQRFMFGDGTQQAPIESNVNPTRIDPQGRSGQRGTHQSRPEVTGLITNTVPDQPDQPTRINPFKEQIPLDQAVESTNERNAKSEIDKIDTWYQELLSPTKDRKGRYLIYNEFGQPIPPMSPLNYTKYVKAVADRLYKLRQEFKTKYGNWH